MAKADVNATSAARANLACVVTSLDRLAKNLAIVRSTAVTVELALKEQASGYDQEMAACISRNIVDAVWPIEQEIAEIVTTHREKPPQTVRSGGQSRPICSTRRSNKASRKGSRSRRR